MQTRHVRSFFTRACLPTVFRILPLLACILLAAGCVRATPYQPAPEGGPGYRQQQIESNRYRVTFEGNEATPRETVENYLLYRAAELTLAEGFDYFIVTERDTEKRVEYDVSYAPVYGYYPHGVLGYGRHGFPYYAHGYAWAYQPQYWTDRRYIATAFIVMGQGSKPADNPAAFDAREVQQNLEPQIRRPGEE